MTIDAVRQAVLVDIAYEVGGAGLAGFHNLLAAYRAGQWATAAAELKSSLLYSQVPKREQENIMILVLGEFPAGVTNAKDLVKRHEGCTLVAKPDAKGKWAWGWGEDIDAPPAGAPAPTCTQEYADARFEVNFATAEARAEADVGSDSWFTSNPPIA